MAQGLDWLSLSRRDRRIVVREIVERTLRDHVRLTKNRHTFKPPSGARGNLERLATGYRARFCIGGQRIREFIPTLDEDEARRIADERYDVLWKEWASVTRGVV